MRWSDVSEVVGKVAPVLGGALGGPAGAAVGSLAARALGVDATPEAVADAIKQDPQAAIKLAEIEADTRKSMTEAQGSIITAEAKSESWLARNWRPLVMLWFAGLVGGYWFGFTPANLTEPTVLALFDIIQYGLSGYIVGRSAEKITKTLTGSGIAGNFMDRIRR